MSYKQKLDFETKVNLVKRYLSDEIGLSEAAQEAGVAWETIRRWVAKYEAEGSEAFLPHKRNKTYSPELKIKVVKEYLLGAESLLGLCKKYKISDTHVVSDWIKKYNAHGDFNFVKFSGGGSYMKQGRATTQKERIQIAEECLASGKNYGEMALKYNVSYQQVRNWTLRYEELGAAGLEDRRGKRKKEQQPRTELEKAQIEIERLKYQLHRTEMERDLLKKLDEVVRRDVYHK